MIRQLTLLPAMLALVARLMLGQLPAFAQMNGYQGGQLDASDPGGMDMLQVALQLNFTDAQMRKINDIFKTQNRDVLNALTPEQRQTLKEQLAEQPVNVPQRLGALKLTVDQQTKLLALHNAMAQEMMQGKQHVTQESVRALQDKYLKQVLALLTPEQIGALSSDFAQSYARLQVMLTMTVGQDQDQRVKIAFIRQQAIKQAEVFRDDATLNDEQKTVKMNDLFDTTVKLILAVLPSDQQKQLKLLLLAREYQEQQSDFRSLNTLNLTDRQQTNIYAITQKAQQDIMHVLTTEQQQKLQGLLQQHNDQPHNN